MWSNITSGFNVEDETANFGTRAVAESEVAVFETNTLATIQSQNKDQLNSVPVVYTEYYLELGCCLVIDNSVVLFNENCSQTLLNLTFDATVDAVHIIGKGKFILIGLHNGELYLYHIPSTNRIFTRSFNETPTSTKLFVKIECQGEENNQQIFVVTGKGKIFRITNLKLAELEVLCEIKDSASIEKLVKDIVYSEMFSDSPLQSKVTAACGLELDGVNSFLLVGKDICFRSEYGIEKTCPVLANLKLKKIEITQNKSLCFGLTENGKLLALCMHTLIPIFVWDDFPVVDFTLLDRLVFDAESNLLVITAGETYNMLLLSWPGFSVKFKLQVQPVSHLVYQQSGSEDVLYVEGFGDDKIDTVRLKTIVETQPEFRLQRILRKGRFEEAEKFARTFNLNMELVYIAQVQRLMQDLQPWNNNPDSMRAAFVQFMTLLEKITDVEFVCECCINAIPPDFTSTQTLLEYGFNRLSKLPNDSYVRGDLLQKINSISLRLSTYQQIHGASINSESWLHFLKADLFGECQKRLKRGEIRDFVSIWSRHWHEIKAKLSWSQALMLLEENIPTWTKAKDIALWLRHFVPPTLALYPDIIQHIMHWTVEKIKTLEVSEREDWPEVGLGLARCVLHILQVPLAVNDPLGALQENLSLVNHCAPVTKLIAFIRHLQDLQTLQHNYSVVISFIDFLQLSDQELMMVILEYAPIEKIKSLMSDFLKKMMIQRNLVSDRVISVFIQELVDNSVDWSQWDEVPWDMRVAALIPCIHEFQVRLECVLLVLKVAPVPWNNIITQIAQDALKLKHPLTDAVQECMDIIPQKLIYKKYNFNKIIQSERVVNLVIKNILLQDRESALQDVLTIAKSTTDKCHSYQTIIMHFIEKGNYGAALEVLASLDADVASQCKDFIWFAAQRHLKIDNVEEAKHYMEILPVVRSEEDCLQFKKYFALKTDKTVDISFQDFCFKTAMSKRLSEHTAVILKGLLDKQVTERNVINKIPHYVRLLDTSSEEWIVSIASQAVQYDFSLAYSFASNIKELSLLPDDVYCKVLTLAVSLMTYYKVDSDTVPPEDVIELVCKLATQCVTHCSSDLINKHLEMLIWFGLLKSPCIAQRSVYSDIYTDPLPSSSTVRTLLSNVRKMLKHYVCTYRASRGSLQSQALQVFEKAADNLCEDDIEPRVFQRMRNEQQHLTGIGLLISFYWSMYSLAVPFEAESMELILNQNMFELLRKLTNSRHFDNRLAFDILHHFDKEEALLQLFEVERSVSSNYQKLISLYHLGLTYCKVNKVDEYYKYFSKKYNQCLWAKKISELGIPYKEVFKEDDHEQKIQLLLKLMKTPAVTLDLLKEYCMSMRIDFQKCLELYLEEILLSWEPVLEFKTNSSGKKEMLVKHSSDDLKKRCFEIIDMVNSETKQQMQNTLQSLWDRVNGYYYEVFIVIIELVEILTQGKNAELNHFKLLLGFLSTYIRISEAQSVEKEHWFESHPSTQSLLPAIAEFRLPFTLLSKTDSWKIIEQELNITTYKMWFDVIPLLRLDKNTLCTLTVHRLTSKQLSAGDSAEDPLSWCLQLKNKSLLAEIKECVSYITNLEMVSASLYYVVSHMPPGADQVAAAEMCYLEAQKWVSLENNEKARMGFAKVKEKYLSVSTCHILHSHQLGDEKYLQLVMKPKDLIYELYHDPSILKRKSGCTTHLPNINKAVDAIEALNKMHIINTRFDILNDWLQAGSMNLDASVDDATSNITFAMLNQKNDPSLALENENIIRACYLIESLDIIKAVEYLSAIALGGDDVEYHNVIVKIRALQCLCAVASKDIIEEVTARKQTDIWRYMQTLMFEHELEKLGLTWLADKSDIVRSLLKRSSLRALCIAAAICREFNVNAPEHWNTILLRMISFEMIDTLCTVLPDLTPQSHLINQDVFRSAWNTVIVTPLSKAVLPLNDEGKEKIEKSIEMLHKCPIPLKIDRTAIIEHCKRLQTEDLLAQLGHL